jgi:hypothetical protein
MNKKLILTVELISTFLVFPSFAYGLPTDVFPLEQNSSLSENLQDTALHPKIRILGDSSPTRNDIDSYIANTEPELNNEPSPEPELNSKPSEIPLETQGEVPSEGEQESNLSEYQISPQIVEDELVPPFSTTMSLNGGFVNHLTRSELNTNYSFGSNISSNFYLEGTYRIQSQVEQSLTKDNVFTSEYRGIYTQVDTTLENRKLITTFTEPVTLTGLQMQITFTGGCQVLGVQSEKPTDQCSYLPALVTDRQTIEPDFFIPTRIEQKGDFGQIISQESIEKIQQPGFQNTGVNGETIGLDLYFPNVGPLPGNSLTNKSTVERQEDLDLTYSAGIYRVQQTVKANHQEAVLGRSVRGFTGIVSERNLLTNTVVQSLGQLLPEINPSLEGSTVEANANINKNLFMAANNTRLPDASYTIYHAGIGHAQHSYYINNTDNNLKQNNGEEVKPNGEKYSPIASFHSIYLGLSPVIKRSYEVENKGYEAIGKERFIAYAGGEGGANNNISFVSAVNDQLINSYNLLNDFYIQAYLGFLERDAYSINQVILTEETTFYPHLSISGNFSGFDQVFRYYTGWIAAPESKLYLGADYTKDLAGWQVSVGGIGYTNEDKEYFSKVEGSLAKNFYLTPTTNIVFNTGFRYAFFRQPDILLDNPIDNFYGIGLRLNSGIFSLGITQLLDVFPDSIGNKIQAEASVTINNTAKLTAYTAPQRGIDTFGATAQFRLGNSNNSPSLGFNWSHNIYYYGQDSFGNELETDNDNFTVFLNWKNF